MYLEYLLLIIDYFKTLSKKSVIFEIITPIVFGIIIVFLLFKKLLHTSSFLNYSMNFIGVLLGFTLAIITFLVASDNENIQKTKKHITEHQINKKNVSLYRILVINYSYLIVIETFVCLSFLIGSLIYYSFPFIIQIICKTIYIILVLHILSATIRTSTDLYLVLSKEDN